MKMSNMKGLSLETKEFLRPFSFFTVDERPLPQQINRLIKEVSSGKRTVDKEELIIKDLEKLLNRCREIKYTTVSEEYLWLK